MNLLNGNRHMVKQCLTRHAIIAARIIGGDTALVSPKDMHLRPWRPVASGSVPCGLFQKNRSVVSVRAKASARVIKPCSTPTG